MKEQMVDTMGRLNSELNALFEVVVERSSSSSSSSSSGELEEDMEPEVSRG